MATDSTASVPPAPPKPEPQQSEWERFKQLAQQLVNAPKPKRD